MGVGQGYTAAGGIPNIDTCVIAPPVSLGFAPWSRIAEPARGSAISNAINAGPFSPAIEYPGACGGYQIVSSPIVTVNGVRYFGAGLHDPRTGALVANAFYQSVPLAGGGSPLRNLTPTRSGHLIQATGLRGASMEGITRNGHPVSVGVAAPPPQGLGAVSNPTSPSTVGLVAALGGTIGLIVGAGLGSEIGTGTGEAAARRAAVGGLVGMLVGSFAGAALTAPSTQAQGGA